MDPISVARATESRAAKATVALTPATVMAMKAEAPLTLCTLISHAAEGTRAKAKALT